MGKEGNRAIFFCLAGEEIRFRLCRRVGDRTQRERGGLRRPSCRAFGLTKQPHGGIPEAVVAPPEPTPVGRIGEQQIDRLSQRTGQVRHRGIGADNQIAGLDGGRRDGEIGEPRAEVYDSVLEGRGCRSSAGGLFCRLKKAAPGQSDRGARSSSAQRRCAL